MYKEKKKLGTIVYMCENIDVWNMYVDLLLVHTLPFIFLHLYAYMIVVKSEFFIFIWLYVLCTAVAIDVEKDGSHFSSSEF